MQRNDRWPEEFDAELHSNRSRPPSRRNSASSVSSRKSSVKKEGRKIIKSPLNTAPNSSQSTPKKSYTKTEKPDFLVTGKQILKRVDRANSLPGVYRRPSTDSLEKKSKRCVESPKRVANVSQSSKSRETSLEDDMSLDLSQVSDFEDTNSKYGTKARFLPGTTSTPKSGQTPGHKPRSASFQSQKYSPKLLEGQKRSQQSFDSSKQSSSFSFSRERQTSSATSNYRYGPSTELDYSSVSPEYSGQSSAELSPRTSQQPSDVAVVSPFSQRSQVSGSSCFVSWVESQEHTKVAQSPGGGEWANFWVNYNNSVSRVPMKTYYDQCPTPYRTENIDLADLDISANSSRKRSPDNVRHITNIIRNEGLHLTPRETQNMIKCAHILGSVLTKAIDRNSKQIEAEQNLKVAETEKEARFLSPEVELKKKNLSLDLREQHKPLEVAEEKKSEDVTTQTDISLPNTKSAPRIFEKILRQLSKSSIDESILQKKAAEQSGLCNNEVKDDKV